MPKITLLGAGSGFTSRLFIDTLNIEGMDSGVIGLVDIDKKRLDIMVKLMNRVLKVMGKDKGWKIEASTDRKKVMPKTDYLISTVEVSGVQCVRFDNDIPLKYGIDQCIGDTIGPGGYFGEMALFDNLQRSATVTATEPTRLLMLHKREFSEVVREYPQVALQICTDLSRRVRELQAKLQGFHQCEIPPQPQAG